MRWRSIAITMWVALAACRAQKPVETSDAGTDKDGYKLVWADEFNNNGRPDTANWDYERGFVRNDELQWYQPENAFCEGGNLIIEARREEKPNPGYVAGSRNWRSKRQSANYTSSCLITAGKASWMYGRFEMRGRIAINEGIWPAWWTLGAQQPWPENGEIDIMEYYKGNLLANIAVQGKEHKPEWFSNKFPVDSMGGAAWASRFHIWRMDWTKEYIALYVDDVLLNKVPLDRLANKNDTPLHPFRQPHYMLLNLAIGGMNGGDPAGTEFPKRFEIDYVRVYQKS